MNTTNKTSNEQSHTLSSKLSENAESISSMDSRIKTKNGFYQQKTYTLASTNEKRIYKSSITDKEKPDTLQDMICDLEDTTLTKQDRIYNQSIASINNLNKNLVDESIRADFESFIKELSTEHYKCAKEWRTGMRPYLKKFNKLGQPKKAAMRRIYMNLLRLGQIEKNQDLENYLIAKASRTQSGVMVVTVLTSPYPQIGNKFQKFSCKHNCYYCPNEPDMPRSYLSDEPAVQRGWKHHWSAIEQFYARIWTYYLNGHNVDKIELLVLGGTWSEYPREYQQNFIRDCFYAANTFYEYIALSVKDKKDIIEHIRLPMELIAEQKLNECAKCRIIGITLETRPDSINKKELQKLRFYGCTRVQIGIQHTNDEILKKINRGCTNNDAINCVKLLKNTGFKLDFHLMPDLPGTSIEKDEQMFDYVLNSTLIQADQWKIYPCQTTKFTVIQKWFEQGTYVPFEPKDLLNLLIKVKCHVHPWIRLNRVIRDIPNQYILGGNEVTNLRQFLGKELEKNGAKCACIRCREIRGKELNFADEENNKIILKIRSYESSDGMEYFISFETINEEIIFGFVRLRICNDFEIVSDIFPELVNCAMIRELHVYGQMIPVFDKKRKEAKTQHMGFGKKLMNAAEIVAAMNGFKKMSVIAGVGTRNYYRKIGYKLKGTYMIKTLRNYDYYKLILSNKLTLIKTCVPYKEMVEKLKNGKANYDCSMTKSDEVANDLVVGHYEIKKNVIFEYCLHTNAIVVFVACFFVFYFQYFLR